MVEENNSGICLCGACSITVDTLPELVSACHCSTCRRWGGGPLMTIEATEGVQLSGGDNLGVYVSSAWAERGFCRQCGTHLFYRMKEGEHYFIPAGLFNEELMQLDHQVFIDEKPGYYDFAQQTQCLTGAEVFEYFAKES